VARRVFFSFHYDNDIWRANQVRNCNVVAGVEAAGFFDHSEYLDAKKRGDAAIQRMILRHLERTTVTVVLIGMQTASRPWVQYEIAESIKRGNGLLGIFVHHLKNQDRENSWFWRPDKPAVPWGVRFPCYDWDKDVNRFRREIELAGRQADENRQAQLLASLGRRRAR
jgi:Thoeris protein ThsB, TIR-like domain